VLRDRIVPVELLLRDKTGEQRGRHGLAVGCDLEKGLLRDRLARAGLEFTRRARVDDFAVFAEQFADEWDQIAFDPDYDTLPLEHFEERVRAVFGAPKSF
jgi:hypothetical protein